MTGQERLQYERDKWQFWVEQHEDMDFNLQPPWWCILMKRKVCFTASILKDIKISDHSQFWGTIKKSSTVDLIDKSTWNNDVVFKSLSNKEGACNDNGGLTTMMIWWMKAIYSCLFSTCVFWKNWKRSTDEFEMIFVFLHKRIQI